MINKSKLSLDKLNKLNHKNLIKKYKINFNPLLLPKLALVGYHLKKDPSFQVFLSKLQLFDKYTIQRQNLFIEHMKQLIMSLEGEGDEMEEKLLLVGIEKQCKKEIKSCINLEEDKYKYGKILTSRLIDLNQFIFHVERLDKQPIQEKQCKSILEKEINKIKRMKSQYRKSKQQQQLEQAKKEENKKYFKLSQFKLSEMNRNIKNVGTMLSANRVQRKYKKSRTQAFCDIKSQQQQQQKDGKLYQRQAINTMEQSQDQAVFTLGQLVVNIDGKMIRKSTLKPHFTSQRANASMIKIKRNDFKKAQTQGSQQIQQNIKVKKRQQGKSVRYNIRNNDLNVVDVSQNNKATSIANIRSSRSIIKSDKIATRGSQSQIFKNSRHFLRNSKKKSIKINFQKDNLEEQSDSSDEKIERTKSKLKSVKFSEHLIQQKSSYIKPKKQGRKFGRKQAKMLFQRTQSIDVENEDSNTNKQNLDSKRQLNSSKILRRDAFQQQPTTNLANPIRSVANLKRKGRILGVEANKHLERLLMEQNIQQMLIDNELYDKSQQLFQKYKSKKNKGKYSGRRLASEVGRSAARSKAGKHNILMEVDIDDQTEQSEDSQLYIHNDVFKVTPKDLKTIRQSFVQTMPYHHKHMAQFYGGEHFQSINHQFNTNQHGQYYFNRLVMHNVNHNSLDDYIPYAFPQSQNRFESLRFDFGRHLFKQLSNIQQKNLQSNAAIITYL